MVLACRENILALLARRRTDDLDFYLYLVPSDERLSFSLLFTADARCMNVILFCLTLVFLKYYSYVQK